MAVLFGMLLLVIFFFTEHERSVKEQVKIKNAFFIYMWFVNGLFS